MSDFSVRRVVTGVADDGTEAVVSDGVAPNTEQGGALGVSEVFWSDGPAVATTAPFDRDGSGFPLEPPAGGASVRVIRMPGIPPGTDPDDTWLRVAEEEPDTPGMHATDTLDLMIVLEGSVVLGLDDGERTVTAGEYVVQRGTRHRWRPADERGWTYLVAMLRPLGADAGPGEPDTVVPATAGDSRIRRVVTGSPTVDGGAATFLAGEHATLTDLWLTGGPVAHAAQGGDAAGPWALEPPAGGASFRELELVPDPSLATAMWHATATVDVDVILSGRVRLDLRGDRSVELGPGDVVVQRGTDHRWVVLGDEPMRMATVMLSATP